MLEIKKRSLREYALYSGIISLGIILDQFTKWLAVKFVATAPDKIIEVIPGIFNFSYTENKGAAFGSFENSRWVFLLTSTIMIVALSLYLYLGLTDSKVQQISVAVVLSGGIGNMIDRLGAGFAMGKFCVVDFLEFAFVDFAIFNVADAFVCVGAVLLFIAMLSDMIKEEREKKLQANTSDEDCDKSDGKGE